MAEERLQAQIARETTEKSVSTVESIPVDETGYPLVKISWSAAELVPTRQFANVVVGPATVTRYIKDGSDEHISEELKRIAQICEMVVSEDRETVGNQLKQSEQGRLLP